MPVTQPLSRPRPPSYNIGTPSWEAVGQQMGLQQGFGGVNSVAYPSANLMIAFLYLTQPQTLLQMWALNGATASGNLDLGVYNASGTRLVSKGATAQSGTSAMQLLDVTDTPLPAWQQLYCAIACDAVTLTFQSWVGSSQVGQLAGMGIVQVAAAYVLPASATFAALTFNVLPWFGMNFVAVL